MNQLIKYHIKSYVFVSCKRLSLLVAWLWLSACTAGSSLAPAAQPVLVDYDTEGVLYPTPNDSSRFFPGAVYDAALTSPETCLGHPVGAVLASPEDIVRCFRLWSKESPRVIIEPAATSFEGRELLRVVITSPKNHERLEEIKSNLGKLANPRNLGDSEAKELLEKTPAVAWFGYSIHGDEVSGADASLAFGYHLLARTDSELLDILDEVVVVLDPVMNPDGRARIMSQIAQGASLVPNTNDNSLHRGRWPWGRGNHYLFDMNRDWIVGAAPETRGRWQGILTYHPQLLIDAHEMGPQDTYLFYPYAEPINKHFAPTLAKWHKAFASDHSRAFDQYGWAYYTREWADGWYPGYTDAWGSLNGAIGILYEQASTTGQPLLRKSGKLISYRETVHAQAVSNWSNLRTLFHNRKAILSDYLDFRRQLLTPDKDNRTFALLPGRAPDREERFVTLLLRQGVEVYRADKTFTAKNAQSSLGVSAKTLDMPKGTYLIPAAQPQGALVRAMLEFDPRFDKSFLQKERKELERKGRSKVYDITAWSLGHAFALDVHWINGPNVARTQVIEIDKSPSGLSTAKGSAVAWVVDGRNDASSAFAVAAIELGVQVHISDEPFFAAGRELPRGSLLIRRGENQDAVEAKIERAAKVSGVEAFAVTTGLSSTDGPDLGGRHFHLLSRPRVAILANSPISPTEFGAVWYQLDQELRIPSSVLDAQQLGNYDLRRYNVLILPPAGGSLGALLKPHSKTLAAWIQNGGTLIALGSSASTLANEELGLSQVRLRRNVLEDLPLYAADASRSLSSREITIDESTLWEPVFKDQQKTPSSNPAEKVSKKPKSDSPMPSGEKAKKEKDAWLRQFSPSGAILRGLSHPDSWLTFGVPDELPVMFRGSAILLARSPVQAAIRLAPQKDLRLSGLLWPEARERIAESIYASIERVGSGQVILFANSPSFRALFAGTARLLSNAVVYGPSLGARQPSIW